jgi:hypothetical protein
MKNKRIGPNIMGRADCPEKTIEMDKCVLCDKETKYPKNMHVDYRYNYVEGSGQLCDDCANRIYK